MSDVWLATWTLWTAGVVFGLAGYGFAWGLLHEERRYALAYGVLLAATTYVTAVVTLWTSST